MKEICSKTVHDVPTSMFFFCRHRGCIRTSRFASPAFRFLVPFSDLTAALGFFVLTGRCSPSLKTSSGKS
jgi:hypothetical protein